MLMTSNIGLTVQKFFSPLTRHNKDS